MPAPETLAPAMTAPIAATSIDKRLFATFRPQAWINDQAVDIDGASRIDVTNKVLELSADEIRALPDSPDNDFLAEGTAELDAHGGPYEVDVDAGDLCAFFGVADIDDLTDEHVAGAKPLRTVTISVEYGMTMQAYGRTAMPLVVPADTADEDLVALARKAAAEAFKNGKLIDSWKVDASSADGYRVVSMSDADEGDIDPDGFSLQDNGMRYLTAAERAVFDSAAGRALLVHLPDMLALLNDALPTIAAMAGYKTPTPQVDDFIGLERDITKLLAVVSGDKDASTNNDDEDVCRTCHGPGATGDDAFDGQCPSCADKSDEALHAELGAAGPV